VNFDKHRFGISAPAKRQSDAPEATGNDQQRRLTHIDALVETVAALPDDWRTVREPDLPAVCVARQNNRYAAHYGLMKVVWIVCEEQVRRAMGSTERVPIGAAEQQVVDSPEHERSAG
jgi:hypothetical protein